jgi:hypothetical protein
MSGPAFGGVDAPSAFPHGRSGLRGAFVSARRARNSPDRRFPARVSVALTHRALGWLADALGWLAAGPGSAPAEGERRGGGRGAGLNTTPRDL